MTKKMILAVVLSAVAFTACGKKDGYKARISGNNQKPQANNELAAKDVEAKAEQLILADELHKNNRSNFMSDNLKAELLGISAKISVEGDKSLVEVSVLDSKTNSCVEKVTRTEIESKKMNVLNSIESLGRVTCIDTSCNNLLVLVEVRTTIPGDSAVSGETVDSSVAILMKKDESGVHQPLTTESKNFHQVNRVDIAVQSCLEAESKAADELALKKLREQQDARLKEIEARILAIDARQKEISDNQIMTDEPKALGTEKSKLIQERDGILSSRQVEPVLEPAVEPVAEPVNPI